MQTHTQSVLPKDTAKIAEASSFVLQRLIARGPMPGETQMAEGEAIRMSVERPDGSHADLDVPRAALALLASLLEKMGRGEQVTIVSTRTELTTQQAADILRVSRPYFVKLLTDCQIPYRSVGPRRRVLLEDILRYQERTAAARQQGLDELTAEAQGLGMY